jgi:hypothetical protein
MGKMSLLYSYLKTLLLFINSRGMRAVRPVSSFEVRPLVFAARRIMNHMPLSCAAKLGHDGIVKLLLEYGAPADFKDIDQLIKLY